MTSLVIVQGIELWLNRVKYPVQRAVKNWRQRVLKFNPAHQFTCSWNKKSKQVSLKVKTKKFQTQKILKNHTRKEKERERHKDETSTNDRFKINPTVVTL